MDTKTLGMIAASALTVWQVSMSMRVNKAVEQTEQVGQSVAGVVQDNAKESGRRVRLREKLERLETRVGRLERHSGAKPGSRVSAVPVDGVEVNGEKPSGISKAAKAIGGWFKRTFGG